MTTRLISIPFDACQQHGSVHIPVLSKKEFLESANRVCAISNSIFNQKRLMIHPSSESSYLFFSDNTFLSKFTSIQNGGLKIVCEDTNLWLGFIPFESPNKCGKREDFSLRVRKGLFHHRLNDFSPSPNRLNVKASAACIFSLPSTAQIHQGSSDQSCSINGISFLLLFNYNQTNCGLVCFRGLLPLHSSVPIFCCKQIEPEVQGSLPIQAGNLAVSFLMGKKHGVFYFPVWSLNQWREKVDSLVVEKSLIKVGHSSFSSTLVIFPSCASFDPNSGLHGLKCVLVQHAQCLKIGFIPDKKSQRHHTSRLACFHQSLLETVTGRSKNHYLPGDGASFVLLDSFVRLMAKKNSKNVELIEASLFLLASDDGIINGLFCKKGNFDLTFVEQTHSEKDSLPIEGGLEQSPSEESLGKRARLEEQGETSERAVKESRRAIEEQRDPCQRAEEEANRAEEEANRAEEEANRAEEEANRAEEEANRAEEEANRAEEEANRAEEEANRAEEEANRAEEEANRAEKKANRAEKKANRAKEKTKREEEEVNSDASC